MTLAKEEVEDKIELILDSDTGSDCTALIDELLAHDADQRQRIEELEKGLGCSRSHPHEDMNQICELRTEVARLKNELSQRTNLEGSAPCWNSAHMRQIATLREALQSLYDVQNGCPLPKYQKDWDLAMELTQQALKEVL